MSHHYVTKLLRNYKFSFSFKSKIRSLIGQLQRAGSQQLNFAGHVTLIHGDIMDHNDQPVQGVRISSANGVSSSRSDGSYHLVLQRGDCHPITFVRDGFRLHTETICPSDDYHPIQPIKLRLVWDRSPLYKMPPPVAIQSQTSFAAHVTPTQIKNRVQYLDSNIQAPDFTTTLMDGTLKMRMMPSYGDLSEVKFTLSSTNDFLMIRLYCQGQLVDSYFSPSNKKTEFTFQWNQEDFFRETKYGSGKCHVIVGSKYFRESGWTWSRTSVDVMARPPTQMSKSAIGNFRLGFDSIYEPTSQLIYHMANQRIEPISFNYEKINISTVQINNLVNHYKFSGSTAVKTGYEIVVTENGIYKIQNSQKSEIVSNVKIRGETVFENFLFFTTEYGLFKVDHLKGFSTQLIKGMSHKS